MRFGRSLAALVLVSAALLCAPACGSDPKPKATPDGGISFADGGHSSATPGTCQAASEAKSYIGCDFWPTVVANNVWDIFDYAVVVANGQSVDAEVTVSGGANVSKSEVVRAGSLTKIYLPWVKELKGPDYDGCTHSTPLPGSVIARGGAYHLTSSVPVTVFQFNALEYKGAGGPVFKSWEGCPGTAVCAENGVAPGCFSFSNDASLLLPSTAWTGNYRVTGQKGLGNETQGVGSYFAVTAATGPTNVTVKLPPLQNTMPGNGIAGTSTLTFALAAGDVAQIVAPAGTQHDLSGALVTADRPVQVIAGTPCSVGGSPDNGATCDHLEESVFPAETLGRHYFVAPPTSPGGNVVGHVVRFYGNVDSTKLVYAPARPLGCPETLNAGQVVECTDVVKTGFEVTGDREFAVGTFMLSGVYQAPGTTASKGDPSQSLAVAVEQYRPKYIFLAPDDYDENWVDIIAPADATLELDAQPVQAVKTPIGTGYVIIRQQLGPGSNGEHVLSASKPVGVQVMGFGSFTSYQYPGGLDLVPIAPPPIK